MELTIYKCNLCGNVLIPAIDSGVVPVCCGATMESLVAGIENEKHVPIIERDPDGKHVVVKVSTLTHPMEEEHFIQFIVLMRGDRFGVVNLKPGDEPQAKFAFDDNTGPFVAYEFCNLHGLFIGKI